MHVNQKLRLQLLLQNSLFLVLFLAMVSLLVYLSRDYQWQWDITQNSRNSISQASRNILNQLSGPIKIKAYVLQKSNAREAIRNFIAPYQSAKADLTLEFIDPAEHPKETRAAGIQTNGEMIIAYGKRTEHLVPLNGTLNEESFSNLLMRLARSRQITYLEGHGERRLDGIANHDLGDFGKQLQTKGFKISSLNLGIAQDVPVNTHLLVIASPQVDLLSGEVDKIQRYLDKGGNLLWFIDQEPLHGLQPVAEKLGLVLTPGTVVDPDAQKSNAPLTWSLGAGYALHPVTQNFTLNTVFPFARQIGASEDKGWKATPLVEVAQNGWVEMGKLEGALSFDKTHDIAGPVNVATAFEKSMEDKPQRIVVIGSGAFLSNTYLGNGGNMDLGINIINWLASDDNLITIQPKATQDSRLNLSKFSLASIFFGFLILLPLTLIATGFFIRWRRRKQ